MKSYGIRPEGLNSLEDLFLEEKLAIYLCDSFLQDHKRKQKYISVQYQITILEEMNWNDFLKEKDYNLWKATYLSDFEKEQIANSKRNEILESLRKEL